MKCRHWLVSFTSNGRTASQLTTEILHLSFYIPDVLLNKRGLKFESREIGV